MRQLRTSALRRVKPNWRGAQFATFDWQVASYAGNDIVLGIYYLDGPAAVPLSRMAMTGIPGIYSNELGGQCSAAVLGDGILTITMPDPVVAPFTLRLASNDPALRGDQGEYLCGKMLDYAEPCPPVPTALSWQYVSFTGNEVTLEALGATPPLINGFVIPLQNSSNGEFAASQSVNVGQWTVTFPSSLTAGDNLIMATPSLGIRDQAGNWLNSGSVVLP